MSDDIAERLVRFKDKVCVSSDLEIEAADEITRLRAELAATQVPLCIGRPIISILAREGAWSAEDGRAVVAADDLFGADPYAERDALRAVVQAAFDMQISNHPEWEALARAALNKGGGDE